MLRMFIRCTCTVDADMCGTIMMGHVTFLGLVRRETLSLFHCVYRFVRKFYHRPEPLWISACADLEAFIGVMILIVVGFSEHSLAFGVC